MFTHEELVHVAPNLRKFSLRLCRNQADADDLLQATLVRALEKGELFEDGSNLFGWASKIMFNTFASGYRQKTRYESRYDPTYAIESMTIDATQENTYDLHVVGEAMEKLSPEHREILQLVCIKGLRYEETAELLSIPVGTVRSRLSRAREALRTLLEPEESKMPAYLADMHLHQYRGHTSA